MRIYIALPLKCIVWASLDYDFQTASLIQEYANSFKTTCMLKFIPTTRETKCPKFKSYVTYDSRVYTIIDPETLSLCEEVKK